MATPQLFTISSASVETGKDRRTISNALYGIRPDGKVGQHDGWYLKTILSALDGGSSSRGGSAAATDIAEAERLGDVLVQGLARIEATRGAAKRRKIFRALAPNFGALDVLLRNMNQDLPEHEKDLLNRYREMALGGLLSRMLALCKIEVQRAA
jgi:hypothetical protein